MIKRIYPTFEECKVKNLVKCTETDCNKVFKSDSNLNLHLAKTHGKKELLESTGVKQYHCPELHCIYHKDKYFKNMKFIRQHYLKVHSTRDSMCATCQKTFTSEKLLMTHFPYCGVKFSCCDCKISYPSYETLQTHGRRKKHFILSKHEYISQDVKVESTNEEKKQKLLPKPINFIVVSNINLPKPTQNQSCQTTDEIINIMTDESDNVLGRNTFQKSEPGVKHKVLSIGIQTDDIALHDYCSRQHMKISGMPFHDKSNASSGTQTGPSLNFYSPSKAKGIGDSALTNFEFDNCHMETQTDFIFEDVMLSSDYLMSNMYTQTCDDVFNQFNFNDIQTQTVVVDDDDDMLKSVESQTFMSSKIQNSYTCKDTSHMETQTDTEFRQMLEVINS